MSQHIKVVDCTEGPNGDPDASPRYALYVFDACPAAYEVYDARQLQGGGYTWAAVLESLVRGHFSGAAAGPYEPHPAMLVPFEGATHRFVVDAEGSSLEARSDSRPLLEAIAAKLREVEADPAKLGAVLDAADEALLE